jgi:uncharacterized protein with GYD domain
MPKFLLQVNYTPEGARGLHVDGGTKRYQAAKNATESLGGTLDAFYFSFGSQDVVCIVDAPDAITMAALSLAVTQSGAAETRTTALLTMEDMDHAVSKHTAYRKPGA